MKLNSEQLSTSHSQIEIINSKNGDLASRHKEASSAKLRFRDANYRVGTICTSLGAFRLTTSSAGVVECLCTVEKDSSYSFSDNGPATGIFELASDALVAYARGDYSATQQVPVDLRGTEFQQSVWAALRNIDAGEIRSYNQIAIAVGRPKAVRAVGAACGANPSLIFVPCHRILRSGSASLERRLGGFSAGLDLKKLLLRHEAALTDS